MGLSVAGAPSVSERGECSRTEVFAALFESAATAVEALIRKFKECKIPTSKLLDQHDGRLGVPHLAMCIQANDIATATVLLRSGASPMVTTGTGEPVLHLAARLGADEIITEMIRVRTQRPRAAGGLGVQLQ